MAHRCLAVLLDDVEMGLRDEADELERLGGKGASATYVVRTPTSLADLANDGVDALREGVLEHREGLLSVGGELASCALSQQLDSTHLATSKLSVARHIKDVEHELGNSIATEPQEDVLAVLDEEETVSLETLG